MTIARFIIHKEDKDERATRLHELFVSDRTPKHR
jgi:hypothetical protein